MAPESRLRAGDRLGHYQIVSLIGRGGMGEVYRASDLALDRQVALKVLAHDLSARLRSRFLREAQANARLQHPAIATFFESGEADGTEYLALEYVQGETLREVLARGPLGVEKAINVVSALLEALGHAHAVGLLHRDIKPANIVITPTTPKLLDFGLVKPIEPLGDDVPTLTQLSNAGALMGTWGYMSPEQLRGQPLDERSDLFAVAVVLYEAVTGRAAFPGDTPAERAAAVLAGRPALLSGEMPSKLADILARGLAPDLDRRYPSAAEFLSALRELSSPQLVPTLPDTLAVLDLTNLSGNPDVDWLGSGFSESLAADLAKVEDLSLIGRERILEEMSCAPDSDDNGKYKGDDALHLGLALGCRWLVSGSYQCLGEHLRVTARLTEVPTGRVVFAEKLDGELADLFDMQDRLSASTLEGLQLGPPASDQAKRPSSVAAYEYYARARRAWFRYEKGGFSRAKEMYEKAIELEPELAPALAGLAAVLALTFAFSTDSDDLERARRYAEKAIDVDPGLADGHIWMGYALMRQGRLDDAYRRLCRAMELNDEDFLASYFAAVCLANQERWLESLERFQLALELKPDYGWSWLGLGACHLELDRLTEARWSLRRAAELEKLGSEGATAGVHGVLAECLRRLRELDEARRMCLDALERVETTDHMYRDTMRGICLCTLGRTCFDLREIEAARVAFEQALLHLRGRAQTLGGGFLMVQALVGLARATGREEYREEARQLLDQRSSYDFSFFWTCTESQCSRDLDPQGVR